MENVKNDIYKYVVEEPTFKKICERKVVYLVCLNDKNVQSYKEGNFLEFVNETQKEVVKVRVVRFLYFDSIKDLASSINLNKCGHTKGMNLDKLEDEYTAKYNSKEINKFGFVAIEFELVK